MRSSTGKLEHAEMMTEAGLKQGVCSGCVFYRKEKNARVVVRGDDFAAHGPSASVDWFRGVVQERMEVEFKSRLE